MSRKRLLLIFLAATITLFLTLPAEYTRPTRTDWQWATGYNLTIGQFVAINSPETDARKLKYGNIMADTDTFSRLGGQLVSAAGISAVVCLLLWAIMRWRQKRALTQRTLGR